MDINVKSAIEQDENLKEGNTEYDNMISIAHAASEEITEALVKDIIEVDDQGKKKNAINLQTAILACMRAAVNLCSYMYKDEKTYRDDITESRRCVTERVVPAILNPQPCGKCEACKKGEPCINPDMDTNLMKTSVVPMIGDALLEYDLWNKVMYMHTPEGKAIINSMTVEV